jgi:hypothetical protein
LILSSSSSASTSPSVPASTSPRPFLPPLDCLRPADFLRPPVPPALALARPLLPRREGPATGSGSSSSWSSGSSPSASTSSPSASSSSPSASWSEPSSSWSSSGDGSGSGLARRPVDRRARGDEARDGVGGASCATVRRAARGRVDDMAAWVVTFGLSLPCPRVVWPV